MMEADRAALCGARNVPDVARQAVGGGATRSSVVLGGQRIAITKPRARSPQHGELEPPTFAGAADTDPLGHGHGSVAGRRGAHAALCRHLGQVALGIDTRGNEHVLGLREGSTESTPVVRSLLSELVDRGSVRTVRGCG